MLVNNDCGVEYLGRTDGGGACESFLGGKRGGQGAQREDEVQERLRAYNLQYTGGM